MNQLSILQINVDKGATQYDIALSSAYNEQTDVVLIQEPYISRDLSRRIPKRHPSYNCFTPIDDWANSQPGSSHMYAKALAYALLRSVLIR